MDKEKVFFNLQRRERKHVYFFLIHQEDEMSVSWLVSSVDVLVEWSRFSFEIFRASAETSEASARFGACAWWSLLSRLSPIAYRLWRHMPAFSNGV